MVGRSEIAKDTVQEMVESAATHVGRIANIVTGAVRQIAHEVGDWASDAFEMRDAAGTAARAGAQGTPDPGADVESDTDEFGLLEADGDFEDDVDLDGDFEDVDDVDSDDVDSDLDSDDVDGGDEFDDVDDVDDDADR